ncbi:DUF134 domain-containing protein [Sulfurospirillum arcachonense]|uniref:DUF134 domain-containing protein n=1 Tax=Sulfurospirillum arcachonense TaxID=57666 RepID=UPI0004689818|nr:DUF134 domain-containing protein [Sulfurospirillum arcachonense]
MGRNKIQRNCCFKPHCRKFTPIVEKYVGTMEINSDEMEAIFLMDYQGQYQEDAAKQMNVSRPTLSRIIKSARKKISTAIILGYELHIVDNKDKFVVALSTNKEGDFSNLSNKNPLIALIHIKNKKIIGINYISNPILQEEIKPSQVLPEFLKKYHVNYWISEQIGEGLKNSLLAKGIFIKECSSISPIDDITKLFY